MAERNGHKNINRPALLRAVFIQKRFVLLNSDLFGLFLLDLAKADSQNTVF